MERLPKMISLVAAAAAVAGGNTTAAAQRRGGHRNLLPRHHQSDDRALRNDGDDDAADATVPDVASIVNGTSTGRPLPYMVGLTYGYAPGLTRRQSYGVTNANANNPPYLTVCGGTLISPSVVLTAAHCMYIGDTLFPLNQVLVNLYDKNDPAGVVAINIQDPSEGVDIVIHPDYIDSYGNDIALMFLPVGQVADYAQINDDPHEPAVHDPLRVMGWGRTESSPGSESDVLLETTVDYISNEECKEAYADITEEEVITDDMMCAYKKFTGVCFGDSGGPLFHVDEDGEIGDRPTQVGIASFVSNPTGCASPGYPDVYTRVSYYADWIKETVCSRPEHATKELCGSSKSGTSSKTSKSYTP